MRAPQRWWRGFSSPRSRSIGALCNDIPALQTPLATCPSISATMTPTQPARELGREHASRLDSQDELQHLRAEFIIPSKKDIRSKTLSSACKISSYHTRTRSTCSLIASKSDDRNDDALSIYFCGNSLGLQPRRTTERLHSHLAAWAKKGVLGHFTKHDDSTLPPFLHVDDVAAKLMAPIVGTKPENVAVMETLTANLHFMMASFYRPTREKFKIIIEGKAFPSDHVGLIIVGTGTSRPNTDAYPCSMPWNLIYGTEALTQRRL